MDDTRVSPHFPPMDTYNAVFSGAQVAHAVRNFAEKGRGTRSLLPFGYGDGGGGPTREMLERARRLRDLEGSPRVTVESPRAFFAAAQEEYADAPVWSGELYLEAHRGTYTSHAALTTSAPGHERNATLALANPAPFARAEVAVTSEAVTQAGGSVQSLSRGGTAIWASAPAAAVTATGGAAGDAFPTPVTVTSSP